MAAEEIFALFDSLNLVSNLRLLPPKESPEKGNSFVVLKCSAQYSGGNVDLTIIFDNHFPLHKPIYVIDADSTLQSLPHINPQGSICYMRDDEAIMDITNVRGIIEETFTSAIKTLDDGIAGNESDILDEFEVYWEYTKPHGLIYFLSDPNDNPRILHLSDISGKFFAYDQSFDFTEYARKAFPNLTNNDLIPAKYIPLQPGSKIVPPYNRQFWSHDEIVTNIFQNLSVQNKKRVHELVYRNHFDKDIIIVKVPQANGYSALISLFYNNIPTNSKHPLINRHSLANVVPFAVKRADQSFVIPRGGGIMPLKRKKVLVIGAGSLGGHVVNEIAKTGVLNISIVDSDLLKIENCYRHILGHEFLGKPKVDGLKEFIERNLPFTNITPISLSIEDAIDKDLIHWENYDLVIVATGNPTINLYLNKIIKTNFPKLPIIFSFLEPYGIGGHSLVVNNNLEKGCYQCLYSSEEAEEEGLYNKALFARRGQYFAKSISGCGSLFTPFGSIDAIQTAVSCVRIATDVLLKNETDNPLISWRGDSSKLLTEGYEISERYSQTMEELFCNRYMYKYEKCKICNP